MTDRVTVERVIAAPPEDCWALVSDVRRMGEWSPETVACDWIGGATGLAVGARFRGRNRIGKRRWSTTSTVTDADAARRFAFEVKAGPLRVARWEYAFEPSGAGCRVVETYVDQRGHLVTGIGRLISGVADRAEHNRATMIATLDRLAAVAEASAVENPTG